MDELNDKSLMPFGKHKGKPMEKVPADYLHWLWKQGRKGTEPRDTVGRYIKANLSALKMEHQDGIWE